MGSYGFRSVLRLNGPSWGSSICCASRYRRCRRTSPRDRVLDLLLSSARTSLGLSLRRWRPSSRRLGRRDSQLGTGRGRSFDPRRDDFALDLLPICQRDLFSVWVSSSVDPPHCRSRDRGALNLILDRPAGNRYGVLASLREVGGGGRVNVARHLLPDLDAKAFDACVLLLLLQLLRNRLGVSLFLLGRGWSLVESAGSRSCEKFLTMRRE